MIPRRFEDVHMIKLCLSVTYTFVTFTWPETDIQGSSHLNSWIDGSIFLFKYWFLMPSREEIEWLYIWFFLKLLHDIHNDLDVNRIGSHERFYFDSAVIWRMHYKPLHRLVFQHFFRLLTMSWTSVLYWNKRCVKHPH